MKIFTEYFFNSIFSMLIILIGSIGNLYGYYKYSKRKNKSDRFYSLILIYDFFYLLQYNINYIETNFRINLISHSNLTCKLYVLFNYSGASISPFLLFYLSLKKYLILNKKFLFFNAKIQNFYLIFIFTFNVFYYLPIIFVINREDYYGFSSCWFGGSSSEKILTMLNFVNNFIFPFVLLSYISYLLLKKILKLKNDFFKQIITDQKSLFAFEYKCSLTCLALNLNQILLNLPIYLFQFSNIEDFQYEICLSIFYLSYGSKFFVILIAKQIIRRKVKSIRIFKEQIDNFLQDIQFFNNKKIANI